MIKKISVLMIISLLIISSATPAFCDGPLTKLGRGISNVLTCILEVPEQISRANNSDGPFSGGTVGILKGIEMTFARAAVGTYEIATFPLPCPKDYQPILKDPEYFLQDSDF